MAQVNNHSVDQMMHGLFPKRVLDTVLDAMTDHEKLSLEVLDNETKSRAFALVILKMLKTAASFDEARMGWRLKQPVRLRSNSGNSGLSKCDAPGAEHRSEWCATTAQ